MARSEKTLADYVAIAISPVLIMALVGSLAFFLLEITYAGQYAERLRWILFWFVLASVLVARIAIEQGSEYARLYGLALAGATSLVIFRLVDTFPLVAVVLLGVIWWCTHKLTWDCTLIDENEDASGEGLLQAAGLTRESEAPAEPQPPDGSETARQEPRPPEEAPESGKRPHAPGLWVVYFSLAALPLFGVGQLLIPASEEASRAYAFRLLWIYVASGMGLLLTTSFLGLRRYLRQRKLAMPAAMTGTWMVMGAGLIVAILVLCLLLPRPDAEYSLPALVDKAATKALEASRFAPGANDAGEGEGRRAGKADEKGEDAGQDQQEGREGKGGQQAAGKGDPKGEGQGDKAGDSKQQGRQQGQQGRRGEQAGKRQDANSDAQKGEQPGEEQRENQGGRIAGKNAQQQKNDGGQEQEQAGSEEGSQARSALRQLSHSAEWIGTLAKWLIYGAIAVAALFFLIRNWGSIGRFLSQFWADLLNLFAGRRKKGSSGAADADELPAHTPQPFAAYANPFSTGMAHRMSPEQLVQYTFRALEAWAYEQNEQRPATETPLEFTRRLAERFPSLSKEVRQFASVYGELAYSKRSPAPEASLPAVERLWRRLSAGLQTTQLSAVLEGG